MIRKAEAGQLAVQGVGDTVEALARGKAQLLVVDHSFSFRADGGAVDCQVLEVDPNKTLSYTWAAYGLESVVTWTLTPKGRGTELKLVHSGFKGGPGSEMGEHSGGWAFYVGNLAGVLSGEKDKRPEAMGQKTVK